MRFRMSPRDHLRQLFRLGVGGRDYNRIELSQLRRQVFVVGRLSPAESGEDEDQAREKKRMGGLREVAAGSAGKPRS